jgi:hypothetical protein
MIERERRRLERIVARMEERRRVVAQRVGAAAEARVIEFQQHREAVAVRVVDQCLQRVGTAFGGERRERQAVVRRREQFQRGHAEARELRQASAHAVEAAHRVWTNRIERDVFPCAPVPERVAPRECARIDDLARTVEPFGLRTRRWIGNRHRIVEAIAIKRTRAAIGKDLEPVRAGGSHRDEQRAEAGIEFELDLRAARRPHAKMRARRRTERATGLGAERQAVNVVLRIRIVRTIGHHALLVRTERHGRARGARRIGARHATARRGERNEYAPDSLPRCIVPGHF